MNKIFLINVLLAFTWCAVQGTFTFVNLLFGFVISSAALWLIREQFGTSKYFKRTSLIVGLIFLFLKELFLSVLRVAWLVLKPGQSYRPSFISFPLTVKEPHEILSLLTLLLLHLEHSVLMFLMIIKHSIFIVLM